MPELDLDYVLGQFFTDYTDFPDADNALRRLRQMPSGMHLTGLMGLAAAMYIEEGAVEGVLHVFPDDTVLETALLFICYTAQDEGIDREYYFKLGEHLLTWNGTRITVQDVVVQ